MERVQLSSEARIMQSQEKNDNERVTKTVSDVKANVEKRLSPTNSIYLSIRV
ncbi:MAG: hypothetical protein ACD_4C00028G0004 [uncultured bacterium (gcode 4)]|uniref:Uncharacterized protein n=1 Tax=uncultured bacterium (gcode 4) TaxID=1234023 RepID=K2FZ27_9BACT|nr:MAG: hypothetical protein ACD_4C00028G0004 [uncultured bacterium (gcode 4)]